METQQNPDRQTPPSSPKKWKRITVNDVGIFTVREKDFALVKLLKSAVNYTMFGFVMFMTGLVWLITMLVI